MLARFIGNTYFFHIMNMCGERERERGVSSLEFFCELKGCCKKNKYIFYNGITK